MKKIRLILPIFMLLTSCQTGAKNKEEKHYDYSDFSQYQIEWKNLFFTAKTHYFVYIYSESCLHCINMKDEILPYFEDDNYTMFLIPYSSDIPVGFDTYKTIGEKDIDSMWILGVPSLIEIDNQMVVNNVSGKEDILFVLESQSL